MILENNLSELCLVIGSSNSGKIKEFRNLLSNFPFKILSQPEGLSVEEDGKTFAENARLKAIAVANMTGKLSLADDSGLTVKALSGAPGIYSARYANTDQERIFRLLKEMKDCDDRSARFHSALCIAKPNNDVLIEVEGICEGLITSSPRGSYGFGYDPIFEVFGTRLTFAEMKTEQKKALSHRGKAFQLLEIELRRILPTLYL